MDIAENGISFSVLMPVYNVKDYIRISIESVLKQTYADFELIIIDDGSTDGCGEICDEYASKDARVKVIHNSNHGLLYSRRVAFSLATKDYCVIIDSDDVLKQNALDVLQQTVTKYNSDCIIFGFERVLNGKVLCSIHDDAIVNTTEKNEIYFTVFTNKNYNAIWRKSFRRSLLDGRDYSRYYNVTLGEDLLQSIEVLENATTIAIIPDVLYQYTLNPYSMTQTVNAESYKFDTTVREVVYSFLKDASGFADVYFGKYIAYCLEIISDEISRVCNFTSDIATKAAILKKMRRDSYCNTVLNSPYDKSKLPIKKRFIIGLFKKNFFQALIFLHTMNSLRKLVLSTEK